MIQDAKAAVPDDGVALEGEVDLVDAVALGLLAEGGLGAGGAAAEQNAVRTIHEESLARPGRAPPALVQNGRMRKPVIFITGAGGEIGHGLITRLAGTGRPIVTLDLAPLDSDAAALVQREFLGSILDAGLLERILAEFEVDLVFHLAALLSTRSEFTPTRAHEVNVEGTLTLLEFAQKEGESHGRPVMFLYPSSIAAYGMPDLATKNSAAHVREDDFNHPTTMYGANKLYCEQLGHYYARHYKQLAAEHARAGRSTSVRVRFPGLISAVTVPSGGTSDYAPEMIHAAAQGRAVRVLRPARHAHPVHGDARRRRGADSAGGRPARAADAHGLQRGRVQPVGRRDSRRSSRPRSPTRS